MARQEQMRYVTIAALAFTVTLLGLVAMTSAGGLGAVAFSLYGPLWIILGLAVTIDSLLRARRVAEPRQPSRHASN